MEGSSNQAVKKYSEINISNNYNNTVPVNCSEINIYDNHDDTDPVCSSLHFQALA